MVRASNGFSLLEITVVIFVMGLTITALLQMFEFGHLRYSAIATGWKARANMAELRVWLREKIATSHLDEVNLKNLQKEIRLSEGFKLTDLKMFNYNQDTVFVDLVLFEDRNNNNKPDKTETSLKRLFCFRRRST
ncbi:MAG: hypothetical protein Kow0029_14020 [Candidatus Rifleibacteriota bacterium]